MSTEIFVGIEFRRATRSLIETINGVLDEYRQEGLDLTLRQVFYQLVSRNVVANIESEYKRVGRALSDGRDAGLIDWAMVTDRSRETQMPSTWESPGAILQAVADQFRIDTWADQPNHVEVMLEKQALEGFIAPICLSLGVPFTANRGYCSSTILYEAGKRLQEKADQGKYLWVLYLGDHDPSGTDMTRDVEERLTRYSWNEVTVKRLALNLDQIRRFKLPPQPAKKGDARSDAYMKKHGDRVWELDALEPRVLANLVKNAIEELRDMDLWSAAIAREEKMKKKLATLARRHDLVA